MMLTWMFAVAPMPEKIGDRETVPPFTQFPANKSRDS